jgi:hypothetical protein
MFCSALFATSSVTSATTASTDHGPLGIDDELMRLLGQLSRSGWGYGDG